MGYGLFVHCKACKRTQGYQLGIGMMYGRLEKVLHLVHWKPRAHLVEILKTRNPRPPDYEHKMFACPRCNTLQERFHVRIDLGNSEVFELAHRCRRCRSKLVLAERPFSNYCCPECGSKALVETRGQLDWD